MIVDETRHPDDDLPETFSIIDFFKKAWATGYVHYPRPPIFISKRLYDAVKDNKIALPYQVQAYDDLIKWGKNYAEPETKTIVLKMKKHADSPSWKKHNTGPRKGPQYRNGKKMY